MRNLTVIQPESTTPSPTPSEMRTAGMVSDPSRLAELRPTTLAVMHGSSFRGRCDQALKDLAWLYDGWLQESQS